MPLALDIYVSPIQLKASKHRVSASTNPNEAAVPDEAKLALNVIAQAMADVLAILNPLMEPAGGRAQTTLEVRILASLYQAIRERPRLVFGAR
jgi:hypothetical protein